MQLLIVQVRMLPLTSLIFSYLFSERFPTGMVHSNKEQAGLGFI